MAHHPGSNNTQPAARWLSEPQQRVELAPSGWRRYVEAFSKGSTVDVAGYVYCSHCDSELKDDGSGHDVVCPTLGARLMLEEFDLQQRFFASVMLPIVQATEGMKAGELDDNDPGTADGTANQD